MFYCTKSFRLDLTFFKFSHISCFYRVLLARYTSTDIKNRLLPVILLYLGRIPVTFNLCLFFSTPVTEAWVVANPCILLAAVWRTIAHVFSWSAPARAFAGTSTHLFTSGCVSRARWRMSSLEWPCPLCSRLAPRRTRYPVVSSADGPTPSNLMRSPRESWAPCSHPRPTTQFEDKPWSTLLIPTRLASANPRILAMFEVFELTWRGQAPALLVRAWPASLAVFECCCLCLFQHGLILICLMRLPVLFSKALAHTQSRAWPNHQLSLLIPLPNRIPFYRGRCLSWRVHLTLDSLNRIIANLCHKEAGFVQASFCKRRRTKRFSSSLDTKRTLYCIYINYYDLFIYHATRCFLLPT